MFAALFAVVLLTFGAANAAAQEPPFESGLAERARTESGAAELAKVDVFEVSGLIDRVVANGIERAVERSSANGAQALILQVNSPGAVVDEARMTALLRALRESPLPIAMW
ncbi:MAG: hypothetical protein EBW53_06205, partial [Actinobacteria bacterium]|nr:hypothetical protein [Actinomycetota bacterium]